MRSIRISRIRPADWPDPEDVPGPYETPFGILWITEKGVSHFEQEDDA
jgi:hypothetical protein